VKRIVQPRAVELRACETCGVELKHTLYETEAGPIWKAVYRHYARCGQICARGAFIEIPIPGADTSAIHGKGGRCLYCDGSRERDRKWKADR
jgi:hypothetical protein